MRFLIFEQKYLELLDEGRLFDALQCLQRELTPLNHKRERVHELSRSVLLFTEKKVIEFLYIQIYDVQRS